MTRTGLGPLQSRGDGRVRKAQIQDLSLTQPFCLLVDTLTSGLEAQPLHRSTPLLESSRWSGPLNVGDTVGQTPATTDSGLRVPD